MTTTRATADDLNGDDGITIVSKAGAATDGNMEPQAHVLVEQKCWNYSPPRQSYFCCIFYSCLCITMGLLIFFTNNPTFDQEYNNPAAIHVTNSQIITVTEWQFMEKYIKPSDRMVPSVWVYLVPILVPCLGFLSIRGIILNNHLHFKSREWILDNDISFIKGFCIVFFLCYGIASFIAARISLPKSSAYDICNYDLETEKCLKDDDKTLENAWSSFPNAEISFLVGEMFFFSLYLCNKILMFINKYLSERYKDTLAEHRGILHHKSDSGSTTQQIDNSRQESQSAESSKNDGVLTSGSPQSTDSMLADNNNNNNNNDNNNNTGSKGKYESESAIDTNSNNMGNESLSNISDNNKKVSSTDTLSNANDNNLNNEKNNDNVSDENKRNDNSDINRHPDFGDHRLLSLYINILLIFGFIPSYIAIFISITIVHDDIAYVWDLLGSCVIGIIMAWFTYGLFWDSPFDTMELGYTFDLSGIPKNSHHYLKIMDSIREAATIYVNETNNGQKVAGGGNLSAQNKQNTPVLVDNTTNTVTHVDNAYENMMGNNNNKTNNYIHNNTTNDSAKGRTGLPISNDIENDNDILQSTNNIDESTQPLTK